MAKKATKAQIEQRVRVVYELLLSDAPYSDIVRYCASNWGVKSRMTDNYIKKANTLIIEEAARMRENTLEKHLAQRALIRNKALKAGDPRLAFDILKDESKLLDLYPSAKHEVTGAEGGPLKVIRVASADLDWDSDDE
jgi:hypothetical protein